MHLPHLKFVTFVIKELANLQLQQSVVSESLTLIFIIRHANQPKSPSLGAVLAAVLEIIPARYYFEF